MKRDGPKALTAIYGLTGLKFLPEEKAKAIAIWKISSHRMSCVTNTMNRGWKLVSKLCFKSRTTPPPPQKEPDLLTYKN
jgi:hypothetical protein